MTPQDAQTSLDDIRRLQDQTRKEYVRHCFSRPYMIITALGVFIAFASFDLPGPWDIVAVLLGEVLLVGGAVVQMRRAPVRRRPTGVERLTYLWLLAALLAVYVAFSIVAAVAVLEFGLPAPHTVAAAAVALAILATSGWARRAAEAAVMREKRR